MRLISWNLNKRSKRLSEQVHALSAASPDVVALQEVTQDSAPRLRDQLSSFGLIHACDSFELSPDHSLLIGPRRYALLVASRWPLCTLPQSEFNVPWPERVLSALIDSPVGEIELHNTYVPHGSTSNSSDWTKIRHLEGIFERLACHCARHRVLCGDFNAPKVERPDGTVITWAQREQRTGRVTFVAKRGEIWDRGERNVLLGLSEYNLVDAFRSLHGYGVHESSWFAIRNGQRFGRRFDHVFASRSLRVSACRYLHSVREAGLSDHSAIEVEFQA